jgi:hypothetical protein
LALEHFGLKFVSLFQRCICRLISKPVLHSNYSVLHKYELPKWFYLNCTWRILIAQDVGERNDAIDCTLWANCVPSPIAIAMVRFTSRASRRRGNHSQQRSRAAAAHGRAHGQRARKDTCVAAQGRDVRPASIWLGRAGASFIVLRREVISRNGSNGYRFRPRRCI